MADREKFDDELARALTQLAETQDQLVGIEKMALVGALAAGVAHEINNPLQAVLTNLELLRDHCEAVEPTDLKGALADALDGAHRVASIVRELGALARRDERFERFEINDAARAAVRLVQVRFPKIELALDLGDQVPVIGSVAAVTQVFVTLLVNAAQAVTSAPAQEIVVETRRARGQVVAVVHDRGVGMDEARRARAFEPLFRSRRFGDDAASSGLGLSIARELIAQHGGRLEIDSTPGRGTSVRLLLPAAAARPAPVVEEPARCEEREGRRARVMLVDDEPSILRAYHRLLARECDIVCVGSGREALALFGERQDFDLVLSDLSMPEVSGMELYRRAATSWPELARAFVFVTGATALPEVQAFAEQHRERVLEKPVGLAALRQLIASARRA